MTTQIVVSLILIALLTYALSHRPADSMVMPHLRRRQHVEDHEWPGHWAAHPIMGWRDVGLLDAIKSHPDFRERATPECWGQWSPEHAATRRASAAAVVKAAERREQRRMAKATDNVLPMRRRRA